MQNTLKNLKLKAFKLEELAKKAKKTRNFEQCAKYHMEAAEMFKQINDEKNYKWNMANHYSVKGGVCFYKNELEKAVEFYSKAEKIFLELGIENAAFHDGYLRLRTLEKIISDGNILEYVEKARSLLQNYKKFQGDPKYFDIQITLCKLYSKNFRLNNDYKNAEKWAKKAYEVAKTAYEKYPQQDYKKAIDFNEQIYWNLRAKRLEKEGNFLEASECYKRSGDLLARGGDKLAYDEYVNSYKCMAIVHKYDKKLLEQNINKALEYSDKFGDKKQKFYLLGFKYEHLARFEDALEKKVEFFKQAKENYYKGGDKLSAITAEFFMYYNLSQQELREANYKKALYYLNRAIKLSQSPLFCFPINQNFVVNQKFLQEAYLYIAQAKFSEATRRLNIWLDKNRELESTKRYQFYKILKYCCELLGKQKISYYDLYGLEDVIKQVRENKLSLILYNVCALTYTYLALLINNLKHPKVLDEIKLNIVTQIGKEEAAEELKKRMQIQRAIEEKDWLLTLPPLFIEKFDTCLYLFQYSLDEHKVAAIRDFYTLIEKFLEVVVEFNAKTLWGDQWATKLKQKVAMGGKAYSTFTLGDLVKSLRVLKVEGAELCKKIPEETFALLDKHVPIRNNLTHTLTIKPPDVDIVEDCSKIMYELLFCFPSCIKIINKKHPWYDIEIFRYRIPRRVSLYANKDLKVGGYYYTEPLMSIDTKEFYPKYIFESNFSFAK